MSIFTRLFVTFFLFAAYGCSGGGGGGGTSNPSSSAPPVVQAPAAPVLSVAFGLKTLQFSWGAVANVTHYRLLERPTSASGYSPIGADLAANVVSRNLDVAVHMKDWAGARYILQACNSVGCTDSAAIDVLGGVLATIGYVKATSRTAEDWFGTAVALSADGNTLAVGAPEENSAVSGVGGNVAVNCGGPIPGECLNSGAVFVYARTGNGWTQQAYIKASNTGPGDEFGSSLSLSSDGSVLAVGAPSEDGSDDGTLNDSGAVYLYARTAGTWSHTSYLRATGADEDDRFGATVALNSSGTLLVVGVPKEDSAGVAGNPIENCLGVMDNCAPRSGAVYAFRYNIVTGWSQPPVYLKASSPSQFDEFGTTIALSSDGSTLAVGAVLRSNGTSQAGAVYVYNTSSWTQQQVLTAANGEQDDRFGSGLAISSDGSTIVVGVDSEDSGSATDPSANTVVNAGAVYVFTGAGGVWSEQAYLKASNIGAGDLFGGVLALSSDGNTLAVGVAGEDSAAVGIGGDQNDNTAVSAGAVYVYTRSGASWSQRNYIKSPNAGAGDEFAAALALSGDGNTLVVGARYEDSADTGVGTGINADPDDNSSDASGAVYLY